MESSIYSKDKLQTFIWKKKMHIAEKANQGNLRTRCINYRENM